MACAIATGRQVFGLKASEPAPVLYIEADSPRAGIRARMQAIGERFRPTPEMLRLVRTDNNFDLLDDHPKNAGDIAILANLARVRRRYPFKAVFVDALRSIQQLDMINATSPYKAYTVLKRMFPEAVIVIIHHDRKVSPPAVASEEQTEAMLAESFSGSQAWLDHATVGVRVSHRVNRVKAAYPRNITLTHTKSQVSDLVDQLVLTVHEGGAIITNTGEDAMSAVAKILDTLPGDLPAGAKDRALATALGISEVTAKRRRLKLVSDLEQGDLGSPPLIQN